MRNSFTLVLFLIAFAVNGQEAMFDICPLKNSQAVPSATIYQRSGASLDLKEYIGERPVILVFYRGGWCPYCMRHLSALHEVKLQIDNLGYELIAITPDDFTRLDSSLVRSGNSDYTLFSDKEVNAINAFGIGWKVNDELYQKYKDKYNMDVEWWSGSKHHVLPVPAVFVVKEGKVIYQHVDPKYSQRLSPEILLSFLTAN